MMPYLAVQLQGGLAFDVLSQRFVKAFAPNEGLDGIRSRTLESACLRRAVDRRWAHLPSFAVE